MGACVDSSLDLKVFITKSVFQMNTFKLAKNFYANYFTNFLITDVFFSSVLIYHKICRFRVSNQVIDYAYPTFLET